VSPADGPPAESDSVGRTLASRSLLSPLLSQALPLLAALAAGVAHAAAFSPWNLPWLQVLALAALFALSVNAADGRRAALLGFAFGLGWFGLGVSWVYISMHVYGLMPAPLAAVATLAFCAFLALYPALALVAARWCVSDPTLRIALGLPAFWTLAEWLRGTLFTGFPWLAGGYAHTDTPLAGLAPVAGVYGVTLAAALLAGALALFALPWPQRRSAGYVWMAALTAVTLATGAWLRNQSWTRPAGGPIAIRLVQANIPQDTKFGPEGLQRAFDDHWTLLQGSRVDLIALPESVFPIPLQLVPTKYLDALRLYAATQNAALVFGVFLEPEPGQYYNSAVGIASGEGELRRYSKRHLVPFGEFVPPGFRWFVDLMQIPIGDQQRGAPVQPPMRLAGQRVAVNICYEDLFGEVIIDAWRSDSPPTMMLNLSNLAWFGNSIALPQHLQISRMRALETQHPMLRATNTGATAIIDAGGTVTGRLPFMTAGALVGAVQGMEGTTPFTRYGNSPVIIVALLLAAAAVAVRRPGAR
jgi:apolipoprotein N-acyltransferase